MAMIISSVKVREYNDAFKTVEGDNDKYTPIEQLDAMERSGICQFFRGDYQAALKTLDGSIQFSSPWIGKDNDVSTRPAARSNYIKLLVRFDC